MRFATLITVFACSLLVGCDPVARERVALQLPSAAEEDIAKSAVAVIGEVLARDGFSPLQGSLDPNVGLVAAYGGVGRLGCFVYHRSGEVEFAEMGRFQSRPEATKARDAVRQRLIEKFGKDKVSE